MEFSSKEILKLIEQASGLPDILSKRNELTSLIFQFHEVEEYLERFKSLEELTMKFKELEEKLYVCKSYLSTNEAAQYLSMSKFTLLEAAKRHELPYYTPPSKSFLFLRDELDEWVNSFRIPSLKEIDEQKHEPAGGNKRV